MFISDNILIVALILSFAIISWFTYKSINSTLLENEDDMTTEDNSELEDVDPEFLEYAQTVLEKEREKVQNNKSNKLSEKLKNVRPTIAVDITEIDKQTEPIKPITKNIRVKNKKVNKDASNENTN